MNKIMYENDADIKEYVDKYAKSYGKTVEQALEDRIVTEYIDYKIRHKKHDFNVR